MSAWQFYVCFHECLTAETAGSSVVTPPTWRSAIAPEVKLSKAHANDPGQVREESRLQGG